MALNRTVEKVEDLGSYKIYGRRSLNIGEAAFLAIAVVVLWKKAGVDLKNKWVLLALALIVVAFIVW